MNVKETWKTFIYSLQNRICSELEKTDGKATFKEDLWQRPEGGGGKTRIIANGNVFEKGGVNVSEVFGQVTKDMMSHLNISGESWFACGISIVLHPLNPMVPTVHCNYRMFELYDKDQEVIDRWFGGGTDLTPYYLFEEDAKHFHRTYKKTCDEFNIDFYPTFKKECDQYFANKHRNNERRGIGGIFFDHQRPSGSQDELFWINFGKSCGEAFLDAYLPIVEKRKNLVFTPAQRNWQEIRRGRYVEFNLLHDRGTLFGIKTNGRTESILMSLPPTVRFDYDHVPVAGSEEDRLLQVCLQPVDWV